MDRKDKSREREFEFVALRADRPGITQPKGGRYGWGVCIAPETCCEEWTICKLYKAIGGFRLLSFPSPRSASAHKRTVSTWWRIHSWAVEPVSNIWKSALFTEQALCPWSVNTFKQIITYSNWFSWRILLLWAGDMEPIWPWEREKVVLPGGLFIKSRSGLHL